MKLQNCSVLFCSVLWTTKKKAQCDLIPRFCWQPLAFAAWLNEHVVTVEQQLQQLTIKLHQKTTWTTEEAARGHKTNLNTFSPWSTIQFHPNQWIKSNVSVGCCFTGRSRDWILNEKYKNMPHFSGDRGFDLKWLKKSIFHFSSTVKGPRGAGYRLVLSYSNLQI